MMMMIGMNGDFSGVTSHMHSRIFTPSLSIHMSIVTVAVGADAATVTMDMWIDKDGVKIHMHSRIFTPSLSIHMSIVTVAASAPTATISGNTAIRSPALIGTGGAGPGS